MNHLISMFIDNELSLVEKKLFVGCIREESSFAQETLSLLEQEKRLVAAIKKKVPAVSRQRRISGSKGRFIGLALAACLLLVLGHLFVDLSPEGSPLLVSPQKTMIQKFVIFQKGITQAEIVGTFTGWEKVPLSPARESGYWYVTLNVPAGEHRYAYILDGVRQLADPTVHAREFDDFGAENSILLVGM